MTFAAYHTRLGEGPRAVLALHCTLAHSGAWKPLHRAMPELAITAMDMPSHGRSPTWDETGDFHDLVTGSAAALLDGRMDVIGHSFGASIALRLAQENPEKVRSLTIIEPVIFSVTRADDPSAMPAPDRPYLDAMKDRNFRLAARMFNRSWGDGPKWDDLPEASRAAMARGIHIVPACAAPLMDDSKRMLAPENLARAAMPVLLLRGSRTTRAVGVANEGLKKRLADAESVVVQDAGHMLPITHPDETAAELRRFFARVPL